MKPGIYTDLSIEDYHSSQGISRSGIMAFKKSALHYWYEYINPKIEPKEDSVSMKMGTALHTLVLEQHEFNKKYFIIDKVDGRTSAGKEYLAHVNSTKGNKILLDRQSYNILLKMNESILNHKDAFELIKGGKIENSIYWNDSETNILCKSRPDIMHENMIIDLKTADDASPNAFRNSVGKYGYHIQSGMINDAIKKIKEIDIRNFIYIVVEKEPPYAIGIYVLDEHALEAGKSLYKNELTRYKECLSKNHWPSYETQTISIPNYLLN